MTGLVVGVGCSRGCPAEELLALIAPCSTRRARRPTSSRAGHRRPPRRRAGHGRGRRASGVPLRHPPGERRCATSPCRRRRRSSHAHVGTPSVAEAAALLRAARELLVPKRRSPHATCALAESRMRHLRRHRRVQGLWRLPGHLPGARAAPGAGRLAAARRGAARHARRPLHRLRRVHGDLPRRRLRRAGGMSHAVHPIEAESYRILRARIDLSHLPPLSRAVTERVIHASADLAYADDAVASTRRRCEPGRAALLAGAPLVCDTRMVAGGITRREAMVPLLDPRAAELAAARTSRAPRRRCAWPSPRPPAGAVWVVGNAPTALAELLERPPRDAGADRRAAGRLRRRGRGQGGARGVGPAVPGQPRREGRLGRRRGRGQRAALLRRGRAVRLSWPRRRARSPRCPRRTAACRARCSAAA